MIKYMKSEFYRIVRSKGLYITAGVCVGLMVAMNLVLHFAALRDSGFPYNNTAFSFSMLTGFMSIVFLLTMLMGTIFFGDEYKNKTITNSIAFGCSKTSLYAGKVLTSLVVSAILLAVVLAIYVGSSFILLENSGTDILMEMLFGFVAFGPILIAGEIAAFTLLYLLGSTTAATWSWIGIFVFLPSIVDLLGIKFDFFRRLTKWMVYSIIQESAVDEAGNYLGAVYLTAEGLQRSLIAGIAGIVIFFVIGCVGMSKKDIK